MTPLYGDLISVWPFSLLEIPPTNNINAINEAYLQLSKKHKQGSRENFQHIADAYKAALSGQYYIDELTLQEYIEKAEAYRLEQSHQSSRDFPCQNNGLDYDLFFERFCAEVEISSPQEIYNWLNDYVGLNTQCAKELLFKEFLMRCDTQKFALHYEYFEIFTSFLKVSRATYYYLLSNQLHLAWLFSAQNGSHKINKSLTAFEQECLEDLKKPVTLMDSISFFVLPWKAYAYRNYARKLLGIHGERIYQYVNHDKMNFWLGVKRSKWISPKLIALTICLSFLF